MLIRLGGRAFSARTRVVVVGSGAGGAVAATDLALAGIPTLLLEEGPHHDPATFDQRERTMMPRLYAEGGLRTTEDQSLVILSGRGLGGSTLHNTGLCVPPSPELLDRWASVGALPSPVDVVAADVRDVCERIGASPPPTEFINSNNRRLEAALLAAGSAPEHPLQNRVACSGCGFCTLGCAYNLKRHVVASHLETAVAAGLEIAVGARVQRVIPDGIGWRVEGPLSVVRAEAVIVAASALGTPALLRRSGFARHIGSTLAVHPFAPVGALFDDPVTSWRGVPQSVMAFGERSAPEHRWFVLAGAAPPGGLASQIVGPSASVDEAMRRLPHLAIAGVLVHDEPSGSVRSRRDGLPAIRYRMSRADRAALVAGLSRLAAGFLRSGARKVFLPLRRLPSVTSEAELAVLDAGYADPYDVALSAVHPQASVPAGADPRRSAVDGCGRLHGHRRIYVADASRFPESVGIPPQVTIMALARGTARVVADDLGAASGAITDVRVSESRRHPGTRA